MDADPRLLTRDRDRQRRPGIASPPMRLTIALAALALAPATAGAQGFWSLLPVGQGQTVDAVGVAAFLGPGTVPASFESQRALFEALPAAAPGVATADLGRFLKPAPLTLAAADAVATEAPRAGVTIRRDAFGVPYVDGVTREDVMWGAGWVAGEDRLFAMDAVRLTAQGRLTTLIGPGADGEVARGDAAQLAVTDYRPAELEAMIAALRDSSPGGASAVADLEAYVAGVNAYIDHAGQDPRAMPGEYPALGMTPKPWSVADLASVAGLITGYFGRGGGVELDDALAYAEARRRFGRRAGDRVIADFRAFDDPEAPVTTTRRFAFDNPGRPRDRASAIPDAGSVQLIDRVREASGGAGSRSAPAWLARLRARGGLGLPRHASNATAIAARESASGVPLLFGNPQVDFYAPPLFHEVALHGPGIEARGAALAALGPMVLIGRGPGYAWTITTAQGDNADTFAERLCEPSGAQPTIASNHYRYQGECVALERFDDEVTWTPGPADLLGGPSAQPYRATFHTERSVHGPIIARATVRGKPVAYAFARSTYRRELESAPPLLALNGGITGPRAFQRTAGAVGGSFNFLYADAQHVAYVQSGLYPRRAKGTHPDLPAWGTGAYDWRGTLPFARLPKDVDPQRGYLVSWNNKQAPGWRASDYDWEYGPVHRSQRIERRVRAAIRGPRKLTLGGLVGIAGDAGTVDVRGQEVLPWLLRVLGGKQPADLAPAVDALRAWQRAGAHRVDRDGDGAYDESAAVALMDAWFEPLTRAVFAPVLGRALVARIAKINPIDYLPTDGPDTWFYGWMGYVQRDMRALLGRPIARPPSRVYCGHGKRGACRAILRRTLRAALARVGALDAVSVPTTCPVTEPATCDQLDFIAAGAIEIAPTPWQDRGSFQIAAEPGAAHGG
jgi:acyl-homoserine lactone acylase PvdQ